MDERDVRAALRRVDLDPVRVAAISGGWANWTFDLDGTHIVRFPRSDGVALGTYRELALLPELARHVAFAVPEPSHVATWRDRPFFAYPRIPGSGLGAVATRSGLAPAIGRLLGALHDFPVERAAHLLRLGRPASVWLDRYEDLWPLVADVAIPQLPADLADEVRRRYDEVVGRPPEFPPTLVHNDLGPEHLLVHDTGREGPSLALIDFEDATVGDPAVDLTFLAHDFGAKALPELLAGRDLGDRLGERLWFYRWMGSVHAVIYGVTEGVEEERSGGIAELRRRLAEPPLPV